nr:ROK family protein [Sphingomonas jejuensis]
MFACIEAGGTKFMLGVARGDRRMLRQHRLPTTAPEETIATAIAFFATAEAELGRFAAVGIGTFGPADVDPTSPGWGRIVDTPKPGWSGTDLAAPFAARFRCPVGFDTDVNAAILAEHRWGAAAGADVATYVTVGTGIGGGVIVGGMVIHGLRHPEMGHGSPVRHPRDPEFAGVCPFHGACLEGLASGPAIQARWGSPLSDLPDGHEAHEIIAFYLAQLVLWQQAILSPSRVVFGGGVLATPGLVARIRAAADRAAAGYFGVDRLGYDALIVPSALGGEAGLLGALALAMAAR